MYQNKILVNDELFINNILNFYFISDCHMMYELISGGWNVEIERV